MWTGPEIQFLLVFYNFWASPEIIFRSIFSYFWTSPEMFFPLYSQIYGPVQHFNILCLFQFLNWSRKSIFNCTISDLDWSRNFWMQLLTVGLQWLYLAGPKPAIELPRLVEISILEITHRSVEQFSGCNATNILMNSTNWQKLSANNRFRHVCQNRKSWQFYWGFSATVKLPR